MSVPLAVRVTHCRPDCISTTLRAREFASEEAMCGNPNSECFRPPSLLFISRLLFPRGSPTRHRADVTETNPVPDQIRSTCFFALKKYLCCQKQKGQ